MFVCVFPLSYVVLARMLIYMLSKCAIAIYRQTGKVWPCHQHFIFYSSFFYLCSLNSHIVSSCTCTKLQNYRMEEWKKKTASCGVILSTCAMWTNIISAILVTLHPQAYESRFPTSELIPVFVGSDIISEDNSIDGSNQVIERRCTLNVDAPYLLKKVTN